jgi:hypothetical protein
MSIAAGAILAHPVRRDHGVRELIVAARREHSLELFARNRRPAWISLDDEIHKFTEFSADATTAAKEVDLMPEADPSSRSQE